MKRIRSSAGAGPRRPLAAALLGATLAGCIVPVPGDDPLELELMTPDELRAYTEDVFRRHNRVVTQLMMAGTASLDERQRRRLERAEARMNRACADLNDVASARAAGRDTDLALENRVRTSVADCEGRTEAVASMLERFAEQPDDEPDEEPDHDPGDDAGNDD
jgi:hypothetical protein